MTGTKESFDSIDLKLLQILQKDGRISNARLAEAVGLSQSACFQRVRRLEKKHYITGYNAAIAINRLCSTTLTIYTQVKLVSDQTQVIRDFENYARSNPAILEWHATLGEQDYLLRFLVPSLDRYRQIVNDMMERDLKVKSFTSLVVHRSFAKTPELLELAAGLPSD